MATYVVMQPSETDSGGGPMLPTLVRDGFSWPALVLAPLWLAWHRLWLPAIVVFAAMVVLNAAGTRLGLGQPTTLLSALVSLWVGLEGSAMRLAGLRRRGYADIGVVHADNRDDAELRFAAGLAEPRRPRAVVARTVRIQADSPLPGGKIAKLVYPGES